jgi:hypothetical protein
VASSADRARRWREANPERAKERDRQRKGTAKYREQERTRNERRREYRRWWDRERTKAQAWRKQGFGVQPLGMELVGPVLKRVGQGRAAVKLSKGPKVRRFLGGYCSACGVAHVAWDKGPTNHSTRCSRCTKKRWSGSHLERAGRYGVLYEAVDPLVIYERDRWRCQLCGRKTRRKAGKPTSATLDHIVPMARGGGHIAVNLQCACARCNGQKGAGAANDQLRLIG